MRYLLSLLLFAALAPPAFSDDLILLERMGPGLVPSMKSIFISRYTADLEFVRIIKRYPLLGGPWAALMLSNEELYIAEVDCTAVSGAPDSSTCVPRVVRFHPTEPPLIFTSGLRSTPKSLRLSRLGDLVVTTNSEVVRFDRVRGETLGVYPIPLPQHAVVWDADVDYAGCTVAVTFGGSGLAPVPNTIAFGRICGPPAPWVKLMPPWRLMGVRFFPDGTLLAGDRTIYRFDRNGSIIRAYDTGATEACRIEIDRDCRIEIDRDGRIAVLACGAYLIRVDLESGQRSAKVPIRNGISVGSINRIVPATAPPRRRRSVEH